MQGFDLRAKLHAGSYVARQPYGYAWGLEHPRKIGDAELAQFMLTHLSHEPNTVNDALFTAPRKVCSAPHSAAVWKACAATSPNNASSSGYANLYS